MKRLFILRHAQAVPIGGLSDFERKLTVKGEEDTKILGTRMKEKSYKPELILCSPAIRTSQTLSGLLQFIDKPALDYPRIIYEGGVNELRSLIQETDDRYDSLLLIGHNPPVHQLVFELSAETGDFVNGLSAGYAPATLAVLECPIENWGAIQSGGNILKDLLVTA